MDDGTIQRQEGREAALKLLCPPHKIYPEQRVCRVGIDQRGHYKFFDTLKGRENDPSSWSHGDELDDDQYGAFRELYENGKLRYENGPRGCHLFYYVEEGMELVT